MSATVAPAQSKTQSRKPNKSRAVAIIAAPPTSSKAKTAQRQRESLSDWSHAS